MQSTKIGCQKWVIALYMMTMGLKGVSSMKLHRELGIRQSTAWYMMQRLRKGFFGETTAMQGPVEADEAFVGGKRKNMPKAKRKQLTGRGATGKTTFAGIKDHTIKKVAAAVVSNTKSEAMSRFIMEHAEEGAKVYTDEALTYHTLANHESVKHSAQEFVRADVHTNGIESLWSMLKRGYVGTAHHFSQKYCATVTSKSSLGVRTSAKWIRWRRCVSSSVG